MSGAPEALAVLNGGVLALMDWLHVPTWLLKCAIFVRIPWKPCNYCVASFCGSTGKPKSPETEERILASREPVHYNRFVEIDGVSELYQIRLYSYHYNQHRLKEIHTRKVHMLSVLIVIKRI